MTKRSTTIPEGFHFCVGTLLCLLTAVAIKTQPSWSAQPASPAGNSPVASELSDVQRSVDSGHISRRTFEQLQRALSRDPQNAQSHLLLARCYESRGFGQLAEEEYRLSDQYAPQDPDSLLAQFRRKLAHHDMYAARNLLTLAEQKQPQDERTKLMQALFAAYSNQPDKAEALLMQLVDSPQAPPGAASTLAALRVKQGRYQEAIALCDKDLKRQDDSYLSNASKGIALVQLGQYKAALPFLKRAFSISPFEKGIAQDLSDICLKLNEPSEALKPALINLCLAHDHDDFAHAQITVGYLLNKLPEDQAEAITKDASNILGSTNYAVKLHFLLGRMLAQSGQHQRAINQFEQGLQLDPEFAPAFFQIAQQYEAVRDYPAAMHNYVVACALSPGNQVYSATTNRLGQRLANRRDDLAWQFKDWIWQHFGK